jgi:energy-coupling factor transport system permease protein
MKNFEFLHNVTIGQYLPTGSVIHRLHPAVKMLAAGLLVTATIIVTGVSSLFFALAATLAGMIIARIPFAYAVRGIRPALPILVFVAILQILFTGHGFGGLDGGVVFWKTRFITISSISFFAAGITALRLVVLILIISFFTLCTDVKELSHGTERLLKPFERIRIPAHELSMIITVTMRFLPILSDEAESLIKAQASRGADFGKGKMGLFKRVYRMLPLFVPLLINSLRRAENLVLAMESRCYTGGKGRTHLVRFKIRRADVLAILSVCVVAAIIIISNFGRVDTAVKEWIVSFIR